MAVLDKANIQRPVTISEDYTPEYRLAIGQAIVEYIRDRTSKGLGKDGKKWPSTAKKYTKDYTESLNFVASGKSKTPVNLTLSGGMLSALDIIKSKEGELVIGYETSSGEAGKAEGNIIGSYGKDSGRSSKARDFLALSTKEINKILKDFPIKKVSEETEEMLRLAREGKDKKLNSFMKEIEDKDLKVLIKHARKLYDGE
jgi:hypothetical protein